MSLAKGKEYGLTRKTRIAMVSAFGAAIAMPFFRLSAHGEEEHGDNSDVSGALTPQAVPSDAITPEAMASTHARQAGQHMEAAADPVVWTVLQNLHPVTVHFAIALLVAAAFTDLFAMRRPELGLGIAVRAMVVLGGIGAAIAALFGWIHTGIWLGGDATMVWHRWIGTGLGLAGLALAWLAVRQPAGLLFRSLLFAAALLVIVQGFLGGELGHGAGHLFHH